jgi:hypothetical protein
VGSSPNPFGFDPVCVLSLRTRLEGFCFLGVKLLIGLELPWILRTRLEGFWGRFENSLRVFVLRCALV